MPCIAYSAEPESRYITGQMRIRNSRTEFGSISKTLHWLIAAVMISLIGIGWYASGLDEESILYWRMLDLHISLGLGMFALFLVKVSWMIFSPNPDYVPGLASWERVAARIVHWFFIIAIGLIPLIGFLYTASDGEPINIYDLFEIPDIGSFSKSVRHTLYDVHMYLAYTGAVLIIIHIGAALKHHYIDMNDTLRRITIK